MAKEHIENLKEFYRNASKKEKGAITRREGATSNRAICILLKDQIPSKRRKQIVEYVKACTSELYIITDCELEKYNKNRKTIENESK